MTIILVLLIGNNYNNYSKINRYDDFLFYLKRNDIIVNKIANSKRFKLDEFDDEIGIIVYSSNKMLLKKLNNKDYLHIRSINKNIKSRHITTERMYNRLSKKGC